MEHHRFLGFFVDHTPNLINHSMVIYGATGTRRSRLAATVAVLSTVANQRPTLVFALGEQSSAIQRIYNQTSAAWQLPYEVMPRVYNACDDRPETCKGAVIRHHGIAGTWEELQREIDESIEHYEQLGTRVGTLVVDSFGCLDGTPNRWFVNDFQERYRERHFLVMVGDETDEQPHKTTLSHFQHTCNILVRTVVYRPRSDEGTGIPTYSLEILKTCSASIPSGTYGMRLEGEYAKFQILPPVELYDRMEDYPTIFGGRRRR